MAHGQSTETTEAGDRTWWYVLAGEAQGPVSDLDMHDLLISGVLTANSLVWQEDMQDWQTAAHLRGLGRLPAPLPEEIRQAAAAEAQATAEAASDTRPVAAGKRRFRHLGSSAALALGCLYIAAALAVPKLVSPLGKMPAAGLIGGTIIILGALAYRSCKQRKLAEVKSPFVRALLEVGVLLAVVLWLFSHRRLASLVGAEPITYLIIPVLAILAYAVLALTPRSRFGE
jgi:hypothetical protein